MVRKTVLPNGIRVVSEAMPDVASFTLGVWVENGSRYEEPDERGVSHFLEHLYFKGTERRSAQQIAAEIDAVGGLLNAFTEKECTCYYVRCLAEHAPVALDVLGDLLRGSTFDAEEIERERQVILQEIRQGEDTPDEYVQEVFDLRYWPRHSLSYPVYGFADTVAGLGRDAILRFRDARYRPDRIVVAAAGRLDHDRLVGWANEQLGDLQGSATIPAEAPPTPEPGVFSVYRDLEQVHVFMGLDGVSRAAPERFAGHVLGTALGGGMSSRLFQEVREKRGWAYAIFAALCSYRDCGCFGVYAATSAEHLDDMMAVIRDELAAVAAHGLSDGELQRAKNQLRGHILLGLEGSESRMHRAACSEMYFGRHLPVEELTASIESVEASDVRRLAHELFRPETMAVSVLGDIDGSVDALLG